MVQAEYLSHELSIVPFQSRRYRQVHADRLRRSEAIGAGAIWNYAERSWKNRSDRQRPLHLLGKEQTGDGTRLGNVHIG